jgi:hypothetical protein
VFHNTITARHIQNQHIARTRIVQRAKTNLDARVIAADGVQHCDAIFFELVGRYLQGNL